MFAGTSKFAALAAAILLLAAGGLAQSGRVKPTPTPEEEPVRVITEEVKVSFLARDEAGRFVPDVKAEDLVILENDLLHQATSVRRLPAYVLIVMDTGGELRAVKTLDQTRKTAAAVINSLRTEDQVALMQYSDKAEIVSEWTDKKDESLAAVGRTKFGRRSSFTKALDLAREFMMQEGIENRHLVLITDGTDSLARGDKIRETMRKILGTDISVHIISYTRMETMDIAPRASGISKSPPPKALPDEIAAQLPSGARDVAQAPKIGPTIIVDRKHLRLMRERKKELEAAEDDLLTLAEDTNGTIIIPDTLDEMLEKARLVGQTIGSSYLLTYTPRVPFAERTGTRTVSITSKRTGLIVEARRKLIPGAAK